MLHTVLQNAPFCIAKRTILERKTASFALQKWQFWSAKSAVLERKTHRFGITFALRKVLESTLSVYYQALRAQSNRMITSVPPPLHRWGGALFVVVIGVDAFANG